MARTTEIGWRWMAMLGACAALHVTGCTDIGQDGCDSDDECKGARICSRAVCVEPSHVAQTNGLEQSPADIDSIMDMGAAGVGGTAPPVGDGGVISAGGDPGQRPADVEYICVVGGPGACQNENDCPSIEDGTAKAVAQECGVECATSPDDNCAGACIQDRSDLGPGCSGCLEGFFDCLLSNCLAPCLGGSDVECRDCGRERPAGNTCSDQLLACSGIELNPDYVAP